MTMMPMRPTSLAAFKSFAPIATSLRSQVLEVISEFGADGCTGDQVREVLLGRNMKDGSLNTRYSELENAGQMFRKGDTRLAASGRQQLVMRHESFREGVFIPVVKVRKNPFLAGFKRAMVVARDADPLFKKSVIRLALIAEAKSLVSRSLKC